MNDRSLLVLQDPHSLFAAIVASTDDVIITKTLDGTITYWNPAAERVFGYSAAEAIGQPITLIVPPERRADEERILQRIGRGESVEHFDTVRLARDGRRIEYSVTVSPLRDADGQVVGASSVGRNTAESRAARRQAQAGQEILQLIADNAPSLVSYVDKDCIYQLIGKRHEQWLGMSREEVVGRHARDVVGPGAWERLRPKVEDALAGRNVSFEMEVPLAGTGMRWLNVSYIPHRDVEGRVVGFAVVTTDVDERRRTEDAQRLLVSLHDVTRGLDDPREVLLKFVTQIGRHYQVIRCAYGEVDFSTQTVDITRGYTDGVPSVAGRHPLARFGAGLVEAILAGRVVAIEDVQTDPLVADALPTFAGMQIRAMIVAPIVRGGRTVAMLVVGDLAPRAWSQHQVELLEQVAQRTFFALESARALGELRASEESLSLASRAGRMGAWARDPRSGQVWWSAEMEQLFGLPPGGFRALGGTEQAFFELVHPDDRAALGAAVEQAVQRGDDYQADFRFRHADGSWRWMEGRGKGFHDAAGELQALHGIGIDVTERKRDEAMLRAQAAELAEADRRKDEFLAMLAHELRNPLAPISNALQYLRLKGPVEPELEVARNIIDRQVNQLVRLVDDLLDLSRITRGKMDLQKQRVPLSAIIDSAVESSRPLIDANAHRLVVTLPDDPVEVDADLTRLSQVLQNLLNNAAKYTPRGGQIRLAAEVVEREVVLRVKDNGIGIPPDMLDRVFEMFMQVDRRIERLSGGLGIGLTLVQRLVALHGGRVAALSDGAGAGSEFVIRLPLPLDTPPRSRSTGFTAMDAARPLRVLVVDDNRDAADSLAMMLQALGHQVQVEYDGPAGARAAQSMQVDVALLDIGLPGLNGYELARRIRAADPAGHTVLAAITGWGQQEDRRRSEEAGFDHHLVKPADPLQLRALLLAAANRPRRTAATAPG